MIIIVDVQFKLLASYKTDYLYFLRSINNIA